MECSRVSHFVPSTEMPYKNIDGVYWVWCVVLVDVCLCTRTARIANWLVSLSMYRA